MEVKIENGKLIVEHENQIIRSVLSSCSLKNVLHRINLVKEEIGFDDNGRGITYWDETCDFDNTQMEVYTPIDEILIKKEEFLKIIIDFELKVKKVMFQTE